jgi:hypothetical protein
MTASPLSHVPTPTTDWQHDPLASARLALACLDLTNLNDQDS